MVLGEADSSDLSLIDRMGAMGEWLGSYNAIIIISEQPWLIVGDMINLLI